MMIPNLILHTLQGTGTCSSCWSCCLYPAIVAVAKQREGCNRNFDNVVLSNSELLQRCLVKHEQGYWNCFQCEGSLRVFPSRALNGLAGLQCRSEQHLSLNISECIIQTFEKLHQKENVPRILSSSNFWNLKTYFLLHDYKYWSALQNQVCWVFLCLF